MNRSEALKQVYVDSLMPEIVSVRKEDDYPEKAFSAIRFEPNIFRLRSIEIWDHRDGQFFRIYYSPNAPEEIKSELASIPGQFRQRLDATDFRGDFLAVATSLYNLLKSDAVQEATRRSPLLARRVGYEGLVLDDVDTSDDDILGRTFTWKQILAIDQEASSTNALKAALSQSGVYLQRSGDGTARYVGSAYSEGGILARWLRHLTSNGSAKHLNFFILEYGYSNVLFTVLEVTSGESTLNVEARWKRTLGTNNDGPYDGYRLNCN